MSSIHGSFQSCGDGSHSTSFTCTGASCTALNLIPALTCKNDTSGTTTCTNGNTCGTVANLTSSFAIQGNGADITQTNNVSIGGQVYHLVGSGANFTNLNKTIHSAAHVTRAPGIKLSLFIGFLLFCTHAFAQTPPQLAPADDPYATTLGSLLDPLNVAICQASSGTAKTPAQQAALEVDAVLVCLEDLMATLLGGAGSLSGATSVYNSTLPITDPTTLLAAAVGNNILCLDLASTLWSNPSSISSICSIILPSSTISVTATATATKTKTSSTSSSISTSSVVVSPGLPPNWPSTEAWEAAAGNSIPGCMGCMFSYVYLEVIQETSSPCNSTAVPISSSDLSLWLCDPTIYPPSLNLESMCSYLCANPCQNWGLQGIIASLGTVYTDSIQSRCVIGSCPPTSAIYGNYTCSGSSYHTGATTPLCMCGTGLEACLSFVSIPGEEPMCV